MNEMNIDFWEVANQAIDMAIDNELMKIAKENDPSLIRLLELLNKHNIHGVEAIEFLNDFSKITERGEDNASSK